MKQFGSLFLVISYSGSFGMPDDVAAWLEENQIPTI